MPIEYKASKAFTLGIDGRTVTGIFCVHGNVDDGDGWSSRDRSHPGLFGDFTVEGRRRAVFLWQHRSQDPPIATIDELFEVVRADLPPAVLRYAPDASGGVGCKRTYLDTPRGNEVLAGLSSGALSEMSYAYEPKRWDFEQTGDTGAYSPPIRNLYQAALYDVSDVNWGMNPATSADGAKIALPVHDHHAAVLAAAATYTERIKALADLRAKDGRILSAENRKRIEEAAASIETAAVTLRDLLAASEPPKAAPDRDDMRRLFLLTQRTLATLNGVAHS